MGSSKAPEVKQRRVLLVEDEAVFALDMAGELESHGCSVDIARTYFEGRAMALAPRAAYDGLITDIHLPDGRGDQLVRDLRALYPDVPVVICTAYALADLMADIPTVRLRTVLKPCLAGTILHAMDEALTD